MPPRHQTLPPAQTSSAREAQKSFHCALCSKGYSRMNDYEAHLSSYDHTHKQRLKDMKAMVRDPNAVARARKAEAKADGMVSINLATQDTPSASGAGFKKGGFKKSGFKSAFVPVEGAAAPAADNVPNKQASSVPDAPTAEPVLQQLQGDSLVESDTDDEGYEIYDPRFPTD